LIRQALVNLLENAAATIPARFESTPRAPGRYSRSA